MKFKSYLYAAAAMTLLAACNSEEPNGGKEFGDGDAELTLALKFNGETRAVGASEDGSASESKIQSVAVYLFDGVGEDAKFLARQEAVILNETTGSGEVEKKVKVTAKNDEVRNTKGVVVVVNEPATAYGATAEAGTTTYSRIFGKDAAVATTDEAVSVATANKFVMTNSNYVDAAGNEAYIVPVSTDNWAIVGSNTPTTSLNVYVERIASRVDLTWDGATKTDDADVEFKSWALNVTNKSYFPVKYLKEGFLDSYTTFTDWAGIATKAIWNNAEGHRSYWAVDPNYGNSAADAFNYTDVSSLNKANKSSIYCLENTMNYAFQKRNQSTCAIIVATYVPKTLDFSAEATDNKTTWFVWNNRQYTTSQFFNAVAESLNCGVTGSNLEMMPQNYLRINGEEVGAKTYTLMLRDGVTPTGKTAETVNNELKTLKFECYWNGYCYYEVPVKQFADDQVAWDKTETPNQAKHLGRYGVVRNHIYKLNVNSVRDAGKPFTGQTINTDENDDIVSYKLDVTVNVLKWAVREQSIDL